MIKQISALIKKNFTISLRNGEILQESLIPIVVAIILSLKQYLNTLNQVTPIIYSLAVLSTSRSIMIKLVEEKSQRYRESQKIMGMKNLSYKIGWLLTGYLRMFLVQINFSQSLIIFFSSQYGFNKLFDLDWQFFYSVSFDDLMWPYIIYGFTAINQSFFFSSIFNDTKIVGEVSTFFCVGCSFFVYFTFMNQAADLVSPQCNIGFEYISSLQVGLNRSGCKGPKIPNQIVPINIFPSQLIYDTYNYQQAGIQLFCTCIIYLILYLYFDEIIQDEYGISKHPLFFLQKQEQLIIEKEKLLEQNDQSSAIYNQFFDTDQKPSINIQNLIKTFNDKNAIDNLSLQLYTNELFCLLGHNGAGKTTLISVLTGMICKTSGSIYINDLNLDNDLNEIRLSIGLCTQKDCLYDELTVEQHLQYFASIKQIQNYQQINEILNITELQSIRNKQVNSLSGGEKRKLSLAISLVGDSKLLFLDEPTSGMDAFSRRQIWQIIERIKNQNRTIILTTHYLEEAELLASRIGIMSRGKLIAVGSSEYIKKQFGEGYTLKLKGLPNQFQLKKYISEATLLIKDAESESYLLPFSQQYLLTDLFYELEQQNVQVELTMNTLEDAFIKIGIDEEKLTQQLEKSSFELQEKIQINLKNNNLQQSTPVYKFQKQCIAMFQRRFFTVIRTTTNMIAFSMPVLTFFLGIMVTNYLQFPIKIQNNEAIETLIQVSVLAVVGVIGFSFNSTLYITQTVSERESTLKQILKKMGLKIQAYWIGTFMFDSLIYIIVSSSFFLTGICLQLNALMDYFWMTFLLFGCFGFSYILFIYVCSFMFDKVEQAMRVFVIVTFFITFCIPFMILGILNFLYTIHGIQIFYYFMLMTEIILMLFSPFYNFFLGYTTMPDFSLQITQQFTGLPVILKQTYQYCLMLILQGIIFTFILITLERRLIKKNQTQQSQYIIEAKNLEKSYEGKQLALDNINLQLKKGEILGVIGPNGAGKSTLINIFIDLIEKSNGIAKINNENDLSIGICPQYDCLWEDLTVLEHLNIFAKIKGMDDQRVIQNQISYYTDNLILNLYLNTKAGKLSGGNKRKLCVANALIGGSEILFFDEPTTGVDPSSKRSLLTTIQKTFEYGGYTVILSTLSVDEAQQLANPIGILVQGSFIKYDSPANLINKYSNAYHVMINLTNKDYRQRVHKQIMDLFKSAQTFEEIRQDSLSIQIDFQSFNFYKCFSLLTQLKKQDLIQDFSINQRQISYNYEVLLRRFSCILLNNIKIINEYYQFYITFNLFMNLGSYQFELSSLVQQTIDLKEGKQIELRLDELKLRNKFMYMIRYEDVNQINIQIARFNCFEEEQIIGELMKFRILKIQAVVTTTLNKLEIHQKIPIVLQLTYQDRPVRAYDLIVQLMKILNAQQVPTMFNLFLDPDYKIPLLIMQNQDDVQKIEIIGLQSQLYKFQQIGVNWMIQREKQKKMYIPPFVRQYKLNGLDLFLNHYTGVLSNQIPLRYLKNGGILADETRLGKKLQMLSLILNSNKSTLIITYSDYTLKKWLAQLQQHFQGFQNYTTIVDSNSQQYKMLTFITKENLFKQKDAKLRSNLFKQNWYRVVYDNPESMYSKMFVNISKQLQREITWCVTNYGFKNYDKYLALMDYDLFDQCSISKANLFKQYKVQIVTVAKIEKIFIDFLSISRSYQEISYQYDLPKPQFFLINCQLSKDDCDTDCSNQALNIIKKIKQINGYQNEIVKYKQNTRTNLIEFFHNRFPLKQEEATLKLEEQNDYLSFVDCMLSQTTQICYQCKLKLENPIVLRCQHIICQYCFDQFVPQCNICSTSQNDMFVLQQDFLDNRHYVSEQVPEKIQKLIPLIDKNVKQIVCTQFSSQIPIIYYFLQTNRVKCRYFQQENDLEVFKSGEWNVFIMPVQIILHKSIAFAQKLFIMEPIIDSNIFDKLISQICCLGQYQNPQIYQLLFSNTVEKDYYHVRK